MGKREGCGEETLRLANNYLTTPDSPALEVWGMIEDLGFKIELDSQEPVVPLVPLSLVISPSTYDTKYNFKTFPHYNLANNFLPNYEILDSATLMKWPL